MSKGKFCVNCGVPSMLLCSRCNDSYCSSDCQKADWMRHRPICFKMPTLVPDLDSLELNMLTSLSTVNSGRVQNNDSGLNSSVASPSHTLKKQSEPAAQLLPELATQPAASQLVPEVVVQPAPLKQRSVFAESEPTREENVDHMADSELKPKPVNRSQLSLKTPVPTSVLKLQPASIYGKKPAEPKKAEPKKPIKFEDLPIHKWATTEKVKVAPLGCNENTYSLRESNPQVDAEYDHIASEVAAYCKDKAGCGYMPEVGEAVLALYGTDWYRAQVIDARSDGIIVRYIDFGNLELVPDTDIIALPEQLKFPIYLKDFIVDNHPEGSLNAKQEEILCSDSFTITNIKIEGDAIHCKIFGL